MNTRYLLLRSITLLCFYIPGAYAQKNPLESEVMRFRATTQRDSVALSHLLADELDYMHSNAVRESKSDFIHSVLSQKIEYLQFTPLAHEVFTKCRHAHIIGKVQVKGKYQNTPFEMTIRYLSIYIKKKGRWQLQAWQSLKVAS